MFVGRLVFAASMPFTALCAATLSTGVEIPDGGVPENDGARQYTVRMEKIPVSVTF